MGVRTSRASGVAQVVVDESLCNGCGLCAKVCYGAPLQMVDGRVVVDQSRLFGCLACGACVAACPLRAIRVDGRDLTVEDVLDLPPRSEFADYESLLALLRSRRSVRDFQARDVEPDQIQRILEAASTAPAGIPPSDVGVLVLNGRERVGEFRDETLAWLLKARRTLRPLWPLFRPFMAKDDYLAMRDFVFPVIDFYAETDRAGEDWYFYDAPLAMVFYGCGYADPADPYIAATYSVVAAQSLGLGSCCLGFPGYAVTYSRRVRERFGLPRRVQQGLTVIFGHPKWHPHSAVRRRFARVDGL